MPESDAWEEVPVGTRGALQVGDTSTRVWVAAREGDRLVLVSDDGDGDLKRAAHALARRMMLPFRFDEDLDQLFRRWEQMVLDELVWHDEVFRKPEERALGWSPEVSAWVAWVGARREAFVASGLGAGI